jgi:hypothetical protein
MMLSLLLLVCCCGAGYFTWSTLQLLQNADDALQIVSMSQPPDPAAEVEKEEITTAEEGLNNLSRSSTRAMQTALLAETQNRLPLGPQEELAPGPALGPDPDPIFIEPEPPSLTVVAVMITDTDSAALVSVDGDQDILVRKGAKFSEGTATITKIDAKGVTFTWRRKSYQITL